MISFVIFCSKNIYFRFLLVSWGVMSHMPQVMFSARGQLTGSGRESKLYVSVCLDRWSRVPHLSNPASVNRVARGAQELLQPWSQPDPGRQHHVNLTDNDNGEYPCSKSLHTEMALTFTKLTEPSLPGEFKFTFSINNRWHPVSSTDACLTCIPKY